MTYEQVAKKADELKNRQPERKNPTVREVYAEIGGDYNAVQKHMKTWRENQVAASSATIATLSPEVLRALGDEITQQRGAATVAQSAELDGCREEIEDLQREYSVQATRLADLETQLRAVTAERERLAADRAHLTENITKLQEQLNSERASAENARIELAQTRLKTSGDAQLVSALRRELDDRRAQFESERAARIEAERRLAASEASYQGLMVLMEDRSARMEEVEADRDMFSKDLEKERNRRVDAERGRDIAEARATASSARADDLRAREADLRARIDQLAGFPAKPDPTKPTAQGRAARS